MNKKFIFLTLALLCANPLALSVYSNSVQTDVIQFPTSLQIVPSLPIYYGGHKIPCETNDEAKQLLFTLPKIDVINQLYLYIGEEFRFEVEENTVKYLKAPRNKEYKFFSLKLTKQENLPKSNELDGERLRMPEPSVDYQWHIEEKQLDASRRLPDNTIIICFNPDYISHLEAGNDTNLPRIIVKENICELAGSENQIHETAEQLLLSAIDYNALHKKIERVVKNDHQRNKTIIACCTR